jgi:hypothetical protein
LLQVKQSFAHTEAGLWAGRIIHRLLEHRELELASRKVLDCANPLALSVGLPPQSKTLARQTIPFYPNHQIGYDIQN